MRKSKSKLKEDNEPIESTETEKEAKQSLIDWMPYWKNEKAQFKNAIVRDGVTKKIVEGGWPRPHNTSQRAYENWLSQVINQETRNWFQERDQDGIPIPNSTAKIVVNVITRIRGVKGKNEFL